MNEFQKESINYFKKEWPEIYELKWFSDEEMWDRYKTRYDGDQIPLAYLMVDYHRLFPNFINKGSFEWWLKNSYTKIE